MGGIHRDIFVSNSLQVKENIIADALSRRYVLLSTIDAKLLGFEHRKELYSLDQDCCDEFQISSMGDSKGSVTLC